MNRRGVTIPELLVVVVIIALTTMIGFPKIKDAIYKNNVRSARIAAGTFVAMAKAAAIQRGCTGVVHFSGSAGTVWVTVCPRMATQGSGTIDTIGVVDQLATMYTVTMSETADSVRFDPRGLSLSAAQSTVLFTTTTGARDSILINQMGKVVR
jgi:prepilin-type N-terminal cleavage/methylation domain-containing protein